jgi:hypothetical protein
MLFKLSIFNVLSNAVTQLDNRTFYYSRNFIKLLYIIVITTLCSLSIINTDLFILMN